jgi:hypothetical protein
MGFDNLQMFQKKKLGSIFFTQKYKLLGASPGHACKPKETTVLILVVNNNDYRRSGIPRLSVVNVRHLNSDQSVKNA